MTEDSSVLGLIAKPAATPRREFSPATGGVRSNLSVDCQAIRAGIYKFLAVTLIRYQMHQRKLR